MNKIIIFILILPNIFLYSENKRERISLNNLEFTEHRCDLKPYIKCNYSFVNNEITIEEAVKGIVFYKKIYIDNFQFYQEEYIGIPYGYYKNCVRVFYCEIHD
ncbi:MAG: hypothetical protein MH321_14930 [Leptospiraceae bacterium]|nr:hypothetical protein [Leptospiraceae bacterium]